MRGGGRRPGSDSAAKSAPAAAASVSYDDAQPLNLGAALRACDEHDVVRKGTSRKGRYLMVLPLHLSLEQGGALGTFSRMDTAHPKLVIPTADGRLELEGAFVNTSTSYLVCSCQPRKDHSTCEHVFNQLLVFSDPVLNTNPTTTTALTTMTTTKYDAAAASGDNEDGGAEVKEKEVAPLAPFYGVSDRPPIKVAKRRSSAGASQSAKKRKRSYSGGTSEDDGDDDEEKVTAPTKRKPKGRGSDDDDEEDGDTSDDDAYVDKSFKATPKASAPRRQSLRAVKTIDYSAFDVSDEEEEEEGDEEDGEEGEDGVEDDEDGEEEDEDDDHADVEEVVQLDVSSDEN